MSLAVNRPIRRANKSQHLMNSSGYIRVCSMYIVICDKIISMHQLLLVRIPRSWFEFERGESADAHANVRRRKDMCMQTATASSTTGKRGRKIAFKISLYKPIC